MLVARGCADRYLARQCGRLEEPRSRVPRVPLRSTCAGDLRCQLDSCVSSVDSCVSGCERTGVETRFVTARGIRFGYLEEGTGPLVLLVHGFPDTAHGWDA